MEPEQGTRPGRSPHLAVIRFETFAATFSQNLIDLYFDIFPKAEQKRQWRQGEGWRQRRRSEGATETCNSRDLFVTNAGKSVSQTLYSLPWFKYAAWIRSY